jgi:hypothetical protein
MFLVERQQKDQNSIASPQASKSPSALTQSSVLITSFFSVVIPQQQRRRSWLLIKFWADWLPWNDSDER